MPRRIIDNEHQLTEVWVDCMGRGTSLTPRTFPIPSFNSFFSSNGSNSSSHSPPQQTLLAKTFVEGDFKDFEGFKALERAFDQEHRGDRAHAHFMRSFCQRISTPAPEPSLMRPDTDGNPLVVVSEEPTPSEDPAPNGGGSAPASSPRMVPPGSPRAGDKSPRGGEAKKKKKGAQIADRHPKPHRRGTGPPTGNSAGSKSSKSWPRLSPSATWESARLSPSNGKILLFVSSPTIPFTA